MQRLITNIHSNQHKSTQKAATHGFTIVELLVVIVVIGVLAAITVVAYNGIQKRARDVQRKSDIASIVKALELYHVSNGSYPTSGGSTVINNSWNTSSDASWQSLKNTLQPYATISSGDPKSTAGVAGMTSGGYNYDYYANNSNYCGSAVGQMYILVYRLEDSSQTNTLIGNCASNVLGPYPASNHRVAK